MKLLNVVMPNLNFFARFHAILVEILALTFNIVFSEAKNGLMLPVSLHYEEKNGKHATLK